MTTRSSSPLIPIFFTVFLDMLGVGIIIPVIPTLFFDADSSFFAMEVSRDFRSIMYGLLIASFPFMQFFGAPLLGSLSDRFGRKPLLSTSLTGTMLGYLLFAYAIGTGNLVLLFISRMLPGFFGGNISIVYSAIADVSDEKSRPKNFGLVGMSFGLGFILGPTIGGILADSTLVSWFSPATPFWFTAMLTFCNIVLMRFRFRETLKTRRMTPLNPFLGFRNVATSFAVPRLRVIFTVVLLISLGFSFFTQFFSVLLIEKFSYSVKDIGFLFGWIGVWLVITQGVFV
ncbi:MAG: MFS transporter, partial [Saprospiraceae bacterium]